MGGAEQVASNLGKVRVSHHCNIFGTIFGQLVIRGVTKEAGTATDVTGLEGSNGIAELQGFGGICIVTGINKGMNGILLMTKVLGGLCDIFLAVSLAILEVNHCKEVGHFEVVGERLLGGTQTNLSGKTTSQSGACGVMVGVVDQQLDEIALVDEDSSKEEHITIVVHFLEV